MSEDKPGVVQHDQEETNSFKGQMEARYRERTFLGLVLPEKSSDNHQTPYSELCTNSASNQMDQDARKVMDADSEVSSIFAKRPAMKDLITRFESRGIKKSVSQPQYLDHNPNSSSPMAELNAKLSNGEPQTELKLKGSPVDIINELKGNLEDEPSRFFPPGNPCPVILENSEKKIFDLETNESTPCLSEDEEAKDVKTPDPVLQTTNLRSIAANLKAARRKKENKYTVHKKEWTKEHKESDHLFTVPPSGSPRTSTPKPERKSAKIERTRNQRVKPLDSRPRPHSVQSLVNDKPFPPLVNVPCTSVSLASQQDSKLRTPNKTEERMFKRNIIKEAKKLKNCDTVPDEKKSTAMERYFKFLKSTTPPPLITTSVSQSTIGSSKYSVGCQNQIPRPVSKIPLITSSSSTKSIGKCQSLTSNDANKNRRSLSSLGHAKKETCYKTPPPGTRRSPVVQLRQRSTSLNGSPPRDTKKITSRPSTPSRSRGNSPLVKLRKKSVSLDGKGKGNLSLSGCTKKSPNIHSTPVSPMLQRTSKLTPNDGSRSRSNSPPKVTKPYPYYRTGSCGPSPQSVSRSPNIHSTPASPMVQRRSKLTSNDGSRSSSNSPPKVTKPYPCYRTGSRGPSPQSGNKTILVDGSVNRSKHNSPPNDTKKHSYNLTGRFNQTQSTNKTILVDGCGSCGNSPPIDIKKLSYNLTGSRGHSPPTQPGNKTLLSGSGSRNTTPPIDTKPVTFKRTSISGSRGHSPSSQTGNNSVNGSGSRSRNNSPTSYTQIHSNKLNSFSGNGDNSPPIQHEYTSTLIGSESRNNSPPEDNKKYIQDLNILSGSFGHNPGINFSQRSPPPDENERRNGSPINDTNKNIIYHSTTPPKSPIVQTQYSHTSLQSGNGSPRVSPGTPEILFKDCLAFPSHVDQSKEPRSAYSTSSEIGSDKSQHTPLSKSAKEENVLEEPQELMNDTMSEYSVDQSNEYVGTQVDDEIDLLEVKQLMNNDLQDSIDQTCEDQQEDTQSYDLTSSTVKHSDQESSFQIEEAKDELIVVVNNSDTGVKQNEYSSFEYTTGVETKCFTQMKLDSLNMKYCSETTEIPELTMDEQVSNLVSSLFPESESEGRKDLSSASDLHDSSEITVQVSEEPRSNVDDSYLTNLKMKALGWLKSLQRSTVEIEHDNDGTGTKPERLSCKSDVPQSRFEKQEEQLEVYEKHRDTPVPFHVEETAYQVDIIEQSISSEISVPDHSDHSPKTQDTQIIQDEENISVEFTYEVEGQITQEQTTQEQTTQEQPTQEQTTEEKTDEMVPMLPDQNTIDESIDVTQTPIEENGPTMENIAATAAVAYHFGITNNDVQVAEQEPLQKTPPVKKKKKVDKVEVLEKTEKQKNGKKLKKQKPTKDESSENLVIKKKKKKKKTIQDQQPVKQEPENTVPRPSVVKKKHKKDYEDKVYHDVVPSVSMESKLSIIKNSRQEFRDKSPSKLKEYNSPSSQTSMGSLHSFNSMKQYHSHMSRSPLNRSPMNRSPLNRSPQNRSPTNYSGLSPRIIINNGYHAGYKTKIKPVRRLSAEPTDQFPVWSNIPLAVPGSSPIRPPVKVAMCHRRLREDYMLDEKPSKLPLTKSFCATLDSAVVSEWAMHSWCQNTPATSDAHHQPLWRYAKGDHLVGKNLPNHDMKIEQYYISRIFFLIMAVIALGISQFIYSFHKTEDSQYKYECTEGDEICELKDDLSLYL